MQRLLPAVCISIAVLPAVLAAACDKSPTAPNRPTDGATAASVRLDITGPRTVAPGGTAQFVATARVSDGATRDVTAEAQWRSNTVDLTLSAPGLVTAQSRGEGMLSASFNGLSSTKEVILVPDGTYRLMGTVTNIVAPAGPVALAWVEVISGTGRGLRSGTGEDGTYRLDGVAGEIEVRVTKAGYDAQTKRLLIADHEIGNIVLSLVVAPPDVSGSYTLTIAAADTCSTMLPADAMSRRYSATLTQVGPDLTVTAGGATFGTFNSFVANVIRNGKVEPTTVRLSLGTLGCGGYYYGCGPSLLEQVTASRFFLPSGAVTLNISPTGLAGSLDGVIEVHEGPGTPNLQRVASCRSTRHQITFSR
jgi:hypothetical protein